MYYIIYRNRRQFVSVIIAQILPFVKMIWLFSVQVYINYWPSLYISLNLSACYRNPSQFVYPVLFKNITPYPQEYTYIYKSLSIDMNFLML